MGHLPLPVGETTAKSTGQICPGRILSVSLFAPYTIVEDDEPPPPLTFSARRKSVAPEAPPLLVIPGDVPSSFEPPTPSYTSEVLSTSFQQGFYMPSRPLPSLSPPERSFRIEPWEGGNRGLFNAIDSVRGRISPILIGMGKRVAVPEAQRAVLSQRMLEEYSCIPVFVDDAEYEGHYTLFCKQVLWPLFHYTMPDIFLSKNADRPWRDYVSVNRAFADVVIAHYEPGDTIWIHDYHLMLVPQMLREALPHARIGFFLHIPFPSSELFRCLHVRNAILEGVLGADLVGFQTYSFSRHFLQTVSRILGYETTPSVVRTGTASVAIGIFPIGIDIEALMRRRDTEEVYDILAQMQQSYAGMKVIVGRDKLDRIKGVPHKLLAFEEFLRAYPEWRGKVILIQVATVSTPNRELETQVQDIVTRINGAYGSLPYTPVIYHHQNLSFSHYIALLMLGDACLITPLRDGMNLTAHEYVSCQMDKGSPLILSEFAGTYGSLGGALRVNPWDKQQVAESINEALLMPEAERRLKHAELFGHVTNCSAQFWVESFMSELFKVTAQRSVLHRPLGAADMRAIAEAIGEVEQALVIVDYDAVHACSRGDWMPPAALLDALRRACTAPKVKVILVSGRSRALLDRGFGRVEGLLMCAENGAFFGSTGNPWVAQTLWGEQEWRSKVLDIIEYYSERTIGSYIEANDTVVAWDYRKADPRYGAWQAKELMAHLNDAIGTTYPVHVVDVAKRMEVRPSHVSSVTAVRRLLQNAPPVECVIAVGLADTHEELATFFASDALDRQLGRPVLKYVCPLKDTREMGTYLEGVRGLIQLLRAIGDHINPNM